MLTRVLGCAVSEAPGWRMRTRAKSLYLQMRVGPMAVTIETVCPITRPRCDLHLPDAECTSGGEVECRCHHPFDNASPFHAASCKPSSEACWRMPGLHQQFSGEALDMACHSSAGLRPRFSLASRQEHLNCASTSSVARSHDCCTAPLSSISTLVNSFFHRPGVLAS
jgi:hypothetical protein